MHFSGRVKNLVSHFLSVPAGVRGVVLFALMFFTGMGNVWGETYTYSSDTTITSSNFADGDTIIINNNATLTINLMVPNVTVANIFIGKDGSAGNLLINGPGTLNVGTFDSYENVKNRIKINNYANLVVTGTFYVDKGYGAAADAVTIITGDRTGSLSITGNVNYSGKNYSGVFFDTVNVNVLSDIEVSALKIFLCILNGIGKKSRVNGSFFVKTETGNNTLDSFTSEESEKIVFKRKEESGLAGVTLTSRTSAKLVVDTSAFVALGAENEQTACGAYLFGFFADFFLEFRL